MAPISFLDITVFLLNITPRNAKDSNVNNNGYHLPFNPCRSLKLLKNCKKTINNICFNLCNASVYSLSQFTDNNAGGSCHSVVLLHIMIYTGPQ